MKLVLISDTHGLHDKMTHAIPDGDVLIHAGDFTNVGSVKDVERFDAWLGSLPHKYKIVIAGNHERGWDQPDRSLEKNFSKSAGIIYIEDAAVQIDGILFHGSPWTPTFGYDWAFNADRGVIIRNFWNAIPFDTDVLITHGPPMGILDRALGVTHVGCEDLAKAVTVLSPRLHVFGHIHGDYGQRKIGETTYVNASICNESYEPINQPITFEL
jgi:Icc-related predicted phosphoesterase